MENRNLTEPILDRSLLAPAKTARRLTPAKAALVALLIPPAVALAVTVATIPNPLGNIRAITASAAAALYDGATHFPAHIASAFDQLVANSSGVGSNITFA